MEKTISMLENSITNLLYKKYKNYNLVIEVTEHPELEKVYYIKISFELVKGIETQYSFTFCYNSLYEVTKHYLMTDYCEQRSMNGYDISLINDICEVVKLCVKM